MGKKLIYKVYTVKRSRLYDHCTASVKAYAERINNIVDSLANAIVLEMPRHINRWGGEGGISSMDSWVNELDEIKQFAENRSTIVQNQIMDELSLEGVVQITVNVSPPGSGKIMVNDVPLINEEGTGNYFTSYIK